MKITVIETFTFDGKAHPYNILGYWGCAYSPCSHGGWVRPGEKCRKFQCGQDVDLAHLDCFDALKAHLEKN
jgi:hypothetical protein